MSDFLNTNDIDRFADSVYEFANKEMPKESKKFIKKEAKNLLQQTQSEAIFSGVHHKSHNYYNSIKQGKVYKYKKNGAISNRVYSSDPKAHLLEEGHRMVTHNGKEIGFVEGYHVFKNAAKGYEGTYIKNCEKFIEDVVIKELSK